MMELRATVRLFGGLWIADCPLCGSAEMWGRCHDGSVGGLDGSVFRCRDEDVYGGCGLRCPADWPPNVQDIERLMASRPTHRRNWNPGETLGDLLAENMEHGILPVDPAALESDETTTLLSIAGDEITNANALPSAQRLGIEV